MQHGNRAHNLDLVAGEEPGEITIRRVPGAGPGSLVQVIEEEFYAGEGMAATDLFHQVRVAASQRPQSHSGA